MPRRQPTRVPKAVPPACDAGSPGPPKGHLIPDARLIAEYKVCIYASMERFKRNQIEEAILRTLDARDARARALKLRMKRLLVTDRRLGHGKRSDIRPGRGYAFYSQQPPGSGVEVLFLGYEALALIVAISLLEHGMPQATVVRIMRELRPDLEAAHSDFLMKDRKALFDAEAVRRLVLPGMLAVDNAEPVFLAIVKCPAPSADEGQVRASVAVRPRHEGLADFLKKYAVPGSAATVSELTTLMHQLDTNLARTQPIKRGRSTV